MTDRLIGLVAEFRDCLAHGESEESDQRLSHSCLEPRDLRLRPAPRPTFVFWPPSFPRICWREIAAEALYTPSPDHGPQRSGTDQRRGCSGRSAVRLRESGRRLPAPCLCGSSPFLTAIICR